MAALASATPAIKIEQRIADPEKTDPGQPDRRRQQQRCAAGTIVQLLDRAARRLAAPGRPGEISSSM